MVFISLLAAAALIAIDQIIKYFVIANLQPLGTVTLIDGLLELTYLQNTGIAFGMMQDQKWIFIPLTIIAAVVMMVVLFKYKNHNFWSYTAIALIIAGGIGNLIDRIFLGYVVDYIHVQFFGYIFNFADICVTVGAVCLVIAVLFSGKKEKIEEKSQISVGESAAQDV